MSDSPLLYGLFTRGDDDAPIAFSLPFGPKRRDIRRMVVNSGGVLADPGERDRGDDRIFLADPDQLGPADVRRRAAGQSDVFSCAYVEDCVGANELLTDVLKYRQEIQE